MFYLQTHHTDLLTSILNWVFREESCRCRIQRAPRYEGKSGIFFVKKMVIFWKFSENDIFATIWS